MTILIILPPCIFSILLKIKIDVNKKTKQKEKELKKKVKRKEISLLDQIEIPLDWFARTYNKQIVYIFMLYNIGWYIFR